MYQIIPTTSDGTLLSIAKSKPAAAYAKAIEQIVADILAELGSETVRSIVLRGSVACHTDLPGISDLDMVVFLHQDTPECESRLAALAAKETILWKSLFSLVDLSCAPYDLLLRRIDMHRLYLNLRLTGITIWGEDLISDLPEPVCNRALASRIARQTWLESLQTYEMIRNRQTVSYMGETRGCDFLCVWFLRSFCRGLIVPVMLRRPVFSLNVQTCAGLFAEEYPADSALAQQCRTFECTPLTQWNRLQELTEQCLNLYHRLCLECDLAEAINEE